MRYRVTYEARCTWETIVEASNEKEAAELAREDIVEGIVDAEQGDDTLVSVVPLPDEEEEGGEKRI